MTVAEVLRQMRCAHGYGGRPLAAWLATCPTLNERVRPRRVPLLGPRRRSDGRKLTVFRTRLRNYCDGCAANGAWENDRMAGVHFAVLEGWAVPAQWAPLVDHTYATSSCSLRWGCWGRSAGGRPVGRGTGSSIVADCLSQPNSQAGIVYGRTGVCHQTANRILHPASVTVAGCNGYAVSAFRFGAYGKGNWPELTKCYVSAPTMTTGGGATTSNPQGDDMSRKETYDRIVSKVRTQADDEKLTNLSELAALVEMKLGEPLDKPTFMALAQIQTDLQTTQEELGARLESHSITPDTYLVRSDFELRRSMDLSRKLLGADRFKAIFGDFGLDPGGLIDRERFLETVHR